MEIKAGWGREQLPHELVKHGCKIGAEIGVQSGEYSEKLLSAGIEKLWLIDLWAQQKNYFDIANKDNAHHANNVRDTLARMGGFPFRVTILIGMAHEVAASVPDGSLDFCYIDAQHSLDSVRRDLSCWVPKVRAGGIVSGHDFLDSPNACGSEFGVETAVTEFCNGWEVPELFVCNHQPFPNWHFVKTW